MGRSERKITRRLLLINTTPRLSDTALIYKPAQSWGGVSSTIGYGYLAVLPTLDSVIDSVIDSITDLVYHMYI